MKKIYLYTLFSLIFITRSFAQAVPVFNLNRLSKQDTLLSGWVFHPGDNMQWQSPAFDDSHWQATRPDTNVTDYTALKDAGIGWVRLHLRVDSSLAGQTLAVRINQCTASEIYLDGKLLARHGKVSSNPAEVEAYLTSKEPFIVKLPPGDNVIAVRLAYQYHIPYISSLFEQQPAFALYINDYPSAVANYYSYLNNMKNFILVFALCGGAILIVFFIYIVYFLVDRSKRLNLYYALFCLSICYITMPNELYGAERFGRLAPQMWMVFAQGSFFVIGMLFLVLTVFALFSYTSRKIFTGLVLLGVVMLIYMYFYGTTAFFINTSILPLVISLEAFHVCAWAIRRKIKDARFILIGLTLFVIFLTIGDLLDQSTLIAQILWGASLICFPLGMSFYLGIQSSVTNKQLAASLAEVQMLSAQKQQILADQNVMLERQVAERTGELNASLENLKATQTQLIQSEKMASLGELTAGIAHEIQNPLNFVNNFSEVNREMLEELKAESAKPKAERNERLENELIDDLIDNEEKINHHGKRADAIVKGMLQHSRASSGQKEPTDLNALADEYLRLAYHGLRAKDKEFNAELITHFDEKLPKVNVIPQDIGRVLLNVINNAFYATQQKAKTAGPGYKPEVEISTSPLPPEGGIVKGVTISVYDNGNGIPENIKDKIMQPFFTTKPTGEGTGLGLSLSYDIVVKGHGGKIDVDTKENAFTKFTVTLPIS